MRLCIPLAIWHQMHGYTLAAYPCEITGIGLVKMLGGDYFVDKVFIPQQAVCDCFCVTEDGAINDIVYDIIESGDDNVENLCFRWHSHAGGNVFWSEIDQQDIGSWKGNWVINLVMNTRGEHLARIDFFNEPGPSSEVLEVKIVTPVPPEVLKQCVDEIVQKVRRVALPQELMADNIDEEMIKRNLAQKGGEINEPVC